MSAIESDASGNVPAAWDREEIMRVLGEARTALQHAHSVLLKTEAHVQRASEELARLYCYIRGGQ
jgi:hypothetical protein